MAFEDPTYSPLARLLEQELAGYTDATTKEGLDWREVKEAATYVSTALVKKYGLKEGGTVALLFPNTIWYPIAMYATLRVGGKASGASPAYNVEEMTYALRTADAKFLLTLPNSMEVAVAAAENAGILKNNLFLLEGDMSGSKTIKHLITEGKKEGQQAPVLKHTAGQPQLRDCPCLQTMQITPSDLTRILAVLPSFHITGFWHHLCSTPPLESVLLTTY